MTMMMMMMMMMITCRPKLQDNGLVSNTGLSTGQGTRVSCRPKLQDKGHVSIVGLSYKTTDTCQL